MKLESINSIISNSIEEHEKELQDKMIMIELEYVDKLFLKEIPPLNKDSQTDDIRDLVSKYTEIQGKIMEYKNGKSNEKELIVSKEKILGGISDLYHKDHDHWIEKSEELINQELQKYKNYGKGEDSNKDLENKAGLINFDMETGVGHILPGSGLLDEDICMGIHFNDFYKQQTGDIKNLFSSSSLEKLALKIINEHPETKAVVGESWLMDTPIAKRIGFTVYNRDLEFKGGPFWGQFIDSNGQIKSEEVSKFLKTGKPPYIIAAGAIMVEDFLKKYLPKEKRGVIKLKETTKESVEFIKDLNRITEELKKKWDELSFSEIFALINSNAVLAEYFKTTDGQEYIDMIKKSKELNVKRESMESFSYKNKDEINKKFEGYIKENMNKYIEREVVI